MADAQIGAADGLKIGSPEMLEGGPGMLADGQCSCWLADRQLAGLQMGSWLVDRWAVGLWLLQVSSSVLFYSC
jgi:hypothetical protein